MSGDTLQILTWAGPPLLVAIGWFADRRITRAGERERTERLAVTVDLVERLGRLNMNLDDARQLQLCMTDTNRVIPQAILDKLGWSQQSYELPSANMERIVTDDHNDDDDLTYEITEDTTVGMSYQLSEAIARFDGLIDDELETLIKLGDAEDASELQAAQKAWVAYRDAEGTYAASVFRGGTAASLVGGARVAELCIERIKFLRSERRHRQSL